MEDKRLLIEEYNKKLNRLVISAVVVNLIVLILVLFNVIQGLISWITFIPFFDYYETYLLILFIVDCIFFKLYMDDIKALNDIDIKELNKILLNKKEELELFKKRRDTVRNAYWIFKRAVDLIFKRDNEYNDKRVEYLKLKKDTEDKINLINYKHNFNFWVWMIIIWFIFLFINFITPEWKISSNKIISSYENKYKNLEYEIKNKEDKRYLKEINLSKLESLRDRYVSEFWAGSDIVRLIDKDISELKK